MVNNSQRPQKSIVKLAPHPALVGQLKKQILHFGSLKITGFGIFKLKRIRGIKGFNPYTKKPENFPAYTKIIFVPTKQLKDAIQKWK